MNTQAKAAQSGADIRPIANVANKTWMTAREMALTPHRLSRDGMTAKLANGDVYGWADHFSLWSKQ
jgi:hypothetical protein